jgi:hypothetical protein
LIESSGGVVEDGLLARIGPGESVEKGHSRWQSIYERSGLTIPGLTVWF